MDEIEGWMRKKKGQGGGCGRLPSSKKDKTKDNVKMLTIMMIVNIDYTDCLTRLWLDSWCFRVLHRRRVLLWINRKKMALPTIVNGDGCSRLQLLAGGIDRVCFNCYQNRLLILVVLCFKSKCSSRERRTQLLDRFHSTFWDNSAIRAQCANLKSCNFLTPKYSHPRTPIFHSRDNIFEQQNTDKHRVQKCWVTFWRKKIVFWVVVK